MLASSDRRGGPALLVLLLLLAGTAVTIWAPWSGGPGGVDLTPDPGLDGDAAPTATVTGEEPGVAPSALTPAPEPDGSSPGTPVRVAESAAVAEEPPVERDPRDLVVRVVDPDGRPVEDAILALEFVPPLDKGEPTLDDMRRSGHPDPRAREPVEEVLPGTAVWSADDGLLANLWQALDDGADFPTRVAVVVLVEGPLEPTSPLRLDLDLTAWPEMPLELRLDRAVADSFGPFLVDVRHADGSPAVGIPVALGARSRAEEFGGEGEVAVSLSGEDGIARLSRFEALQWAVMWSAMGEMPLRVADLFDLYVTTSEDLPLERAPRIDLPADARPGDLVRLDLPPVGGLVLVALDHHGQPLDLQGHEWHYTLWWTRPPAELGGREQREQARGTSMEHRVDLGAIALGLELDVSGNCWQLQRPGAGVTVVGPEVPGETLEVRLEFGPPHVELTWLVLDPDGRPLHDTEVRVCLRTVLPDGPPKHPQRRSWRTAVTDAEGHLAWPVPPTAEPETRVFEVSHDDAAWASAPIPSPLPDGVAHADPNRAPRADLGELRLSAEPLPELAQPLEHLLVSGRVVDQAGRPLDRVYLTLRGLEDQRLWARCHSDASGGFELRHGEPGPFYLDLELDGYQTLHLPRLQPGSADQVYVLDEAGSIEGKLRDDLVPVQDGLRIHAHRDGEVHRGRIRGDKLSVAGLAPGTYDLVLGTETWDREFLRVEGVEVVAGEATADPRLADLCASDLARVLRVRVEGQDGTPLEYEDLRVFLPSGEQARVETALLGMLRILVPVDTTWVELGRGPQGRVRVELGDEDQTMRL